MIRTIISVILLVLMLIFGVSAVREYTEIGYPDYPEPCMDYECEEGPEFYDYFAEDDFIDESALYEPFAENDVLGEPMVGQLFAENNLTDEPVTNEPFAENDILGEPMVGELFAANNLTNNVMDQFSAEDDFIYEPSMDDYSDEGTPEDDFSEEGVTGGFVINEAILGTAEEPALADGVYSVAFDTDSSMFHVNEVCEGRGLLTVENGEMTIHITLVSKNIINLYPGLAEDAQKEGAELLEPTLDSVTYSDGITEEVYGFDVPVPYLDEEFDLALIGTKEKWYDHKVSVSDPVPAE